ncbi:hypothetical protein AAVH_34778 [Aphelenchoides avenae]|nr:hypothetical protein AAVH_34778 [Aphelenchus avenae]
MEAIELLKHFGVLQKKLVCGACAHDMKIYMVGKGKGRKKSPQWICNTGECRKKGRLPKVGVRVYNRPSDLKVTIDAAVRFIAHWTFKNTTVQFCVETLGFDKNTTIAWSLSLRNDRKTQTLFSLIQEFVHEDSTIMSDQWAAYRRLCNKGFQDFTVCPRRSQTHRASLGSGETASRERHAKHPEYIEGSLAEWLWFHQNRGQSKFEAIMRDIAAFWPPGVPQNSLAKLTELEQSDSDSSDEYSEGGCNCLGPGFGDWCNKCVVPNSPLE